MTAQDAPQSETTTGKKTMFKESVTGITGASRLKTAATACSENGMQERRDGELIGS